MDALLETISRPSVREEMEVELGGGETIIVYAEGLLRVISPLFDKCSVVLTNERLLVFAPGWPWGFRIQGAEPRTACELLRHKSKIDGARLIVLRHGETVRCLYFARAWREQADLIRSELSDSGSMEDYDMNVEALRELSGLGDSLSQPSSVDKLLP